MITGLRHTFNNFISVKLRTVYLIRSWILIILIMFMSVPSLMAQLPGCTDSLASNYNQFATINDGSCVYPNTTENPANTYLLSDSLDETSGLIQWDAKIWTHNDDGDLVLYALDSSSGMISHSVFVPGMNLNDWEEITHDSTFIYLGDFGNNVNGNRTDLRILRLDKQSLLSGTPVIDTISFSYSDQINFNPTGNNNTDFDCESFLVMGDSLYLFTKQWVSNETSVYRLPKVPGTYSALKMDTYDINGLITGCTYLDGSRLVILSGYNNLLSPFIYLLYDFQGSDFFGANKRRINISMLFHQVEGITTSNGRHLYISNEKFTQPPIINIEPKLHDLDLSSYLDHYLTSLTVSIPQPDLQSELKVFPNPVNDVLYVSIPEAYKGVEYKIISQFGHLVDKGVIGSQESEIDVSTMKKGVYMIRAGEHARKRFVIVR